MANVASSVPTTPQLRSWYGRASCHHRQVDIGRQLQPVDEIEAEEGRCGAYIELMSIMVVIR